MVNKRPIAQTNHSLIAFGANMPLQKGEEIQKTLSKVVNVSTAYIRVTKISKLYRTPAFPENSGPDYVNAAFEVETSLDPQALLKWLHNIEAEMGRERPYRWAPRSCDLDLLFQGDLILPNHSIWKEWASLSTEEAQAHTPTELIIPHPRLHERAFVLGPLMDIAPEFRHPVLGKTVRELWEELPEQERSAISLIDPLD